MSGKLDIPQVEPPSGQADQRALKRMNSCPYDARYVWRQIESGGDTTKFSLPVPAVRTGQ